MRILDQPCQYVGAWNNLCPAPTSEVLGNVSAVKDTEKFTVKNLLICLCHLYVS